jgi:hypothetical protein
MNRCYKFIRIWLCISVCTLLVSCGVGSSGGAYSIPDAGQNVLLLSDIHFNPYAECSKGIEPCSSLQTLIETPAEQWPVLFSAESINTYGEETNNAFLMQGLDNLAVITLANKVKTVLITGDVLTHNFDRNYKTFAPSEYKEQLTEFSAKTLLYVLQQLHKRLPADTKIYFVLGNNDNDSGNYAMQSKVFLNSVGRYLSGFIGDNDKAGFMASFSKGGYASISLSDKIQLIGLNTNPISFSRPNESASMEQLAWFESALINAKNNNKKVIIFQHIPYGLDTFYSAAEDKVYPVLDSDLQIGYLALLKQYAPIITAIYAGHNHREFFSLPNASIPLIGTIAFNSYFGNNPGFKIADILSDGTFNGYTTYYSTLGNGSTLAWAPLYDYQTVYGNPAEITTTLNNFPYSSNIQETNYRRYYTGGDTPSREYINDDTKWKYFYCGIKYVESAFYQQCVNQY